MADYKSKTIMTGEQLDAALLAALDFADMVSQIDRVLLHDYMVTNNDFVAPLVTDDSVLTVIVDDENNAILANWKYKEV